jgi:AcrR family transcriptional regulator
MLILNAHFTRRHRFILEPDSMQSTGKRTAGSTRQRLLDSACLVFAEKGYQDATVAEICEKATANIASVNYYFGSKENLYRDVLHHAFEIATEEFPIDGGLSHEVAAEERLYAFVRAFLMRIFNGGRAGWFQRMVAYEFSRPGAEVEYLFEHVLRPQIDALRSILYEVLPAEITEERRRLCALGIISLCAFFSYNSAARQRFMQGEYSAEKTERLARHITLFALAGLGSATQPLSGEDGCV